jgi:hypothetical protein
VRTLGDGEWLTLQRMHDGQWEVTDDDARSCRCPGRILARDRHYAATTRWTITTPAGTIVTPYSAACALWCHCQALPAALEAT